MKFFSLHAVTPSDYSCTVRVAYVFKNLDFVTGNVGQCVKVAFQECWPVLRTRITLIRIRILFLALMQILSRLFILMRIEVRPFTFDEVMHYFLASYAPEF
jgi:hypothetical protein